ncbi:hypothetical protein G6F50_014499 [Rhizopus delemar]|uniref:Uncharacterized protein n=1 Tax=Rhizopus delemar TaxID=936053 RepID=A0A9P7C7M5_9FUNG|nr:hypothetical protein G6F50_014499 [Rhizopus delemar]
MGAGHRQHVLAGQDVVAQPLRTGHVARARFQDGFHQRVAAADHVADHVQVGLQRHLLDAEAFDQFDPLFGQLRAHGRVHARIATSDLVSGGPRDQRQATHERTADAKNVQVH